MKNLLIIGFVWLEPESTAAGTRMLQLINLFLLNNYKITFVSTAKKNKNSFNLEELSIKTEEIKLNDSSFNVFLNLLKPSIVLFDRYLTEEQFGWRVSETCPDAVRILDTEDLHFLRKARQIAFKKNIPISTELLMSDTAKREIASIYRCDLTLIISKFEMKLLKTTFKINKSLLLYVPFLLNKTPLNNLHSYPSFENRTHFITIGNFKHEPNWDAVLYLKNEIWPLILQKLPKAQMHVYGAYTTEKVQQLNNEKKGFLIKGWTDSVEEVFKNARVCLAPLTYGAGLKGKLIDAMKYGTPSITTTIGAEAMHHKLDWNGFIADNPIEFAHKSVQLYENEKIWTVAQQNGIKIINKCYSKEKYGKKLIEKIEDFQDNLKTNRLKNFTGALLMHHTLESTKYMSKWIEEKNKEA